MESLTRRSIKGRPKTLNPEHVLNIAMNLYWEKGVDGVSVNEICKRANVSKPSLYREFGNEDGLMRAVLTTYQEQVIAPILDMLDSDTSFRATLDNLIVAATTVSEDRPKGCLCVKMRQAYDHVGSSTQKEIDHVKHHVLTAYQAWIQRAQANGDYSANMTPEFAATYIDAQLSNAFSQIARGENSSDVRKVLEVSFSVL